MRHPLRSFRLLASLLSVFLGFAKGEGGGVLCFSLDSRLRGNDVWLRREWRARGRPGWASPAFASLRVPFAGLLGFAKGTVDSSLRSE